MRRLCLLVVAFPFLTAGSCDSGEKDSGDACTLLQNENNYTWTGGLEIPTYETAEHVDLELDWTGLDEDMLCHAMDPVADVDNLGLTRFPRLTPDEVAQGLTNNSLKQSDTNGYVSVEPGDATIAHLSEFNFGGTPYDTVDVYEEAGGTFLLVVANGLNPGQGALQLAFLSPTPTSTVDSVVIEPTCDIVNYDIHLDALTHLGMPGDGPWCIDWSNVTVAGNGEPVVPGKLDEVLIGHYALTAAELEDQFLNIEEVADQLYTLELTGGTTADLSGAVSADGTAFSGFSSDGTWLLALRCTTCTNPAPVFMTLVDPE